MYITQLIGELQAGKKIHRKGWRNQACYAYLQDGIIKFDNTALMTGLGEDDWQIYEQLKISDLKPGQRFKWKDSKSGEIFTKVTSGIYTLGVTHYITDNFHIRECSPSVYVEVV